MFKKLLLIFFLITVHFGILAKEFVVINYVGINCVIYQTASNETFYNVAKRFNVRPSTLAVVNSITSVESVTEGTKLYIPLTETNFF